MCLGCPGHCCKITAELTTYDMVRIVVQEGKEPQDFAEYVEAKKGSVGFRAYGRYNKFALKHKKGACIFLKQKGRLLCSIEDSKPAVCLSYPFTLTKGRSSLRGDALCPPNNKLRADTSKMSATTLEDSDWEWDSYCEIIADWNKSAKVDATPEDFLLFACKEMDRRKPPFGEIYANLRRLLR